MNLLKQRVIDLAVSASLGTSRYAEFKSHLFEVSHSSDDRGLYKMSNAMSAGQIVWDMLNIKFIRIFISLLLSGFSGILCAVMYDMERYAYALHAGIVFAFTGCKTVTSITSMLFLLYLERKLYDHEWIVDFMKTDLKN